MNTVHTGGKPLLLVFPYNVMAHYLRCLQLAEYLRPYFRIKFLYSAPYHSYVSRAGFETFECATLDAEKVQQAVRSFDFSWLNKRDLKHIYHQQVKMIGASNAAAVLGDMSPTLKMAAGKTGVQYFSLINGYMSRYYAFVRKMPKSYPLFKLFNLLPASLLQNLTTFGEGLFFHKLHRPFAQIRKHEGLTAKYSYLQEMEGDVTLLCDLPDLFPQQNLPASYYFIPPLFHLLNNHDNGVIDKLDPAKKTLFISMGSTGDWKKMSFLNHPDFSKYNIVTAADNHAILCGPNVFSYPFINSSRLFAKTDLVICHGGNGTLYQALSHGIPVLCRTAHLEQDYNVDGLERLHLGKSLDGIKNHKEYLAVIEEWIHRKRNPEFSFIMDKITEATGRFKQIAGKIINETILQETISKENAA